MGHGWIFDSLHTQTQSGIFFATLGIGLFLAYLTLFTVLPAMVLRVTKSYGGPWCFAACMSLGEFARSIPFNGFTGLSLGYAFVGDAARGWIPLVGIYGVSFLGYLVAAGVTRAWHHRHTANPPHWFACTAWPAALLWGLGAVLERVDWVTPYAEPVDFRLIQGNVKQSEKFDSQLLNQQIAQYVASITIQKSTLIVTPETALPVFSSQINNSVWSQLSDFSTQSNSNVLIGIATKGPEDKAYNSILHIAPGRASFARYDKVTLMPFGEYAPAGFQWFSRRLMIALQDLTPGASIQKPFVLRSPNLPSQEIVLGSLICHEDLRGQELHRWLPQAYVLINPSNLSWFDNSSALHQRTSIVQARAMEAGRPILRVANTGETMHIDHRGRVVDRLPMQQPGVLRGHVQAFTGLTPYARLGDGPVLLLAVGVVLATFARRFRADRVTAP